MNDNFDKINKSKFLDDDDKLIPILNTELAEKSEQTFVDVKNSSPINAINQITSVTYGKQSGTIMELTNNTNGKVRIKLYYPTLIRDENGQKLELTYTPTTAKLFMLYRWKFTEKGNKKIQISLKDYCKLTGSIRHRAKEKLKQDTAILMNLKLTMEYNEKSNDRSEYNVNLFESCKLTADRIELKCTDFLCSLFEKSSIMKYPLPLLKIPCNERNYPYAFVLVTKLYEMYKMRMYDKKTKEKNDFFFISIKTLLEVCYLNGMKTPEQLIEEAKIKGGKVRYSQFIVKPFTDTISLLEGVYPEKPKKNKSKKNLNTNDKKPPLTKLINVTYCNSDKRPMENEYNGNFTEWQAGYLFVEFIPGYERMNYDEKKVRKLTLTKNKKF